MRDPFPRARGRASLKVVGVGNPWRCDDSAGLTVARRLRGRLPDGVEVLEREGEPTGLLDAWEGADSLWLADAVSSGSEPGTIHRLDAGEEKLPHSLFRASSHHLGLAEAIELARALGRLPREVVVYGIEGASFDAGTSVTPAVAAAAERVAEAILEEVEECMRRR